MPEFLSSTTDGETIVARPVESARVAHVLAEQGAVLLVPDESVGTGSGTSTLAAQLIVAHSEGYRRVIRLRADNEFHWHSDLTRACADLKLPERSVSRPDAPMLGIRHWMHTESEGLLIWLDGVADDDRIQPLVDEWDELHRDGGKCRLLITASEPSLRVRTVPDPICLKGLSPADAVRWLIHHCEGVPTQHSELEAAGVLCEYLAFHPAAIQLVALSARCSQTSLASTLAAVQERLRALQPESHSPFGIAIAVVLTQLQTSDPPVVDTLAKLCCLPVAQMCEVGNGSSGFDQTEQELSLLEKYGLVSRSGGETGIRSESLRRELWAAFPEDVRESTVRSLLNWGCARLGEIPSSKLWTCDAIGRLQVVWPLIDAALRLNRTDSATRNFLQLAVDPLDRVGACDTAASILDTLLDCSLTETGPSASQESAEWFERRGNIRLRQQRFLQARKDFRSCYQLLHASKAAESAAGLRVSLAIVETDLNECRLQRAATRLVAAAEYVRTRKTSAEEQVRFLMLRGAFQLQAGRAAAAEPQLRQAVVVGRSLPQDSALNYRVRILLARTYFALSRSSDAEQALRDDMQHRSACDGMGPLDVAVPQLMLADLLLADGRFAEAEALYRQTHAVRRHSLGSCHRLTGETASRLAVAMAHRGDFRGAEPLFHKAIAIHEDVYGPEHPEVAQVLNDYAESMFVQGKYNSARQLLERALAIQESALRKSDHRIARTRNNLAALYCAEGDFERAEDLYTRDLQVRRKRQPMSSMAVANTLNNLGSVCLSQARFDEAAEHFDDALRLRREIWSQDHPAVAQSLNNLGCLRLQQRRYEDSLSLLHEALGIRETILAPRHPHVAATCEAIGEALFRQGNAEASLPFLQRALAICEEVYGDSHQRSACIMVQLGRAELQLAKRARAELHLRKGEQNLLKTVGPRHRFYGSALIGLAEQQTCEGRHDESHSLLMKSLAVFQTHRGSELVVTDVLHALGESLLARKVFKEARPHLEDALSSRQRWLGHEHLETAQSRLRLATALIGLKELDHAESLIDEALAVFKKNGDAARAWYGDAITSKADVAVARSRLTEAEILLQERLDLPSLEASSSLSRVVLLSRLAGVRYLREDYESAVPLIQECIEIIERDKGRKHPDLVAHCDNLAGVYFHLRRYSEAEALVQRALDILEHEYGENHPAVLELLANYASLLKMCDRNTEAETVQNRILNLQKRSSHVLDEIM